MSTKLYNRAIILSLFILITVFSCRPKSSGSDDTAVSDYNIEYAEGFEVTLYDNYTVVTVNNPWDTASAGLRTYILVNKDREIPQELPQGTLIRTPLDKVVAYSTVHCSFLKELNELSRISGVCEPEYIHIPFIRKAVEDGTIADLGQASNPDVERIILLEPEAVFTTPIQGMSYGRIEKVGIPLIEGIDYMESSPLGRAEWIRFYSLFFEKQQLGDSLFRQIKTHYDEIKAQTAEISERPSVFTEKKYGNVWYLPGGESYMATLLKDAGADYIWKNDPSAGSLSLSFETVLDKAENADTWLIKYNSPSDLTYRALEQEYKPYSYFGAFKNRKIRACNTDRVPYHEEAPVRPDRILKELAAIFHPELFPGYQTGYYQPLAE